MAGARPITEEERQEAFARGMPNDMRVGARTGHLYPNWHNTSAILAHMREMKLLDQTLYEKILGHRMSFTRHIPAEAVPEIMRELREAKNAVPQMAMMSQTVGVRLIGEKVFATQRSDIAGMEDRNVNELMEDPLVQQEIPLRGGVAILEQLQDIERPVDQVEAKAVEASKALKAAMVKMNVEPLLRRICLLRPTLGLRDGLLEFEKALAAKVKNGLLDDQDARTVTLAVRQWRNAIKPLGAL